MIPTVIISSICLLISSLLNPAAAAVNKPNFVIFLADDLGIGDVGCFGNETISTPNIDSIAKQGSTLTHHLSAAAVCTPSRAALLTGRYPIRSGMESSFKNKVFIILASRGGLPDNETTFAKILQKDGYSTALIGKWHLGLYCDTMSEPCHHPLNHGFDYFYGLPLTNLKDFGEDGASVVTTYYPNFFNYLYAIIVIGFTTCFLMVRKGYLSAASFTFVFIVMNPIVVVLFVSNIHTLNGVLMRNYDVIEQPVKLSGLTQRFAREAANFIHTNAEQKKPFLLFLSFVHVHTALFCDPEFRGKSNHGRYGDNIEEMDWAVGEVLHALESSGVKRNTFVYFSSDNGGHIQETGLDGQREGGYNGIYRGGKTIGGLDGGIRVPTVAMWPGQIPAGSSVHVPTSQMDLFPTLLRLAGSDLPGDRIIDGKDIFPVIAKREESSPHEFLYHYCGTDIHAVRYSPPDGSAVWKLHYKMPDMKRCSYVCHCYGDYVVTLNPPLLYNIETDPSESRPLNLDSDPKYHKIIATINRALQKHKDSIEQVPPQFNFISSFWLPWLQPCCNFPMCSCTENVTAS